jgi:hypothetical protein
VELETLHIVCMYKHRTTTRASKRVRASMTRIIDVDLQIVLIGIL